DRSGDLPAAGALHGVKVHAQRVRRYRHLLGVDLSTMQRTRGGQVGAAIVSDADQGEALAAGVLAMLFQNSVMVATTIVWMVSISLRLTVMVLALAPVLVIGVQALVRRLKRHAHTFAHERGELTAMVTERIGAVKLIRGSGSEGD